MDLVLGLKTSYLKSDYLKSEAYRDTHSTRSEIEIPT